jgi:hypothetical protein
VRRAFFLACLAAILLWMPVRRSTVGARLAPPDATRTEQPAPSANIAPQALGVSAGSSHVRTMHDGLAPLFPAVGPDRSSFTSLSAHGSRRHAFPPRRSFPLLI